MPDEMPPSRTFGVVLAGGSGERFWPVSRKQRPKQFLDIGGKGQTLLAVSVKRLAELVAAPSLYVATQPHLRKQTVAESGINFEDHVLAEPAKRNTAGAVVWAMAHLLRAGARSGDVAIFVTADHWIEPQESFANCISRCIEIARKSEALVVIGIPPTRPDTGFGYVEIGAELEPSGSPRAWNVSKFHEKPQLEQAEQYLLAGNIFWNSGMFVWTIGALLRELELHAPQHFQALNAIASAFADGDDERAKSEFEKLPSLSIDCVLLEKSKRVALVESNFAWDDLGTWLSAGRHMAQDPQGNAQRGKFVFSESSDCIGYSATSQKVFLHNLEGIVVIVTEDAILVMPRESAQDVRTIVEHLRTVDVELL